HRRLPARRRPDRGVAAHRAEARLPPLGPPRRTPRRPPLTVDGRPAAREPARLRPPRTRGRPRAPRGRGSPALAGLLRPPGEAVELDPGPAVGAGAAGEAAEALVGLAADDAELGARGPLVERVERRLDAVAGDGPGAQPVVPVVAPVELLTDLVEAPVDEDRVLGHAGAVRPPAAELERDPRPARRRPVPRHPVRPLAAPVVEHRERALADLVLPGRKPQPPGHRAPDV